MDGIQSYGGSVDCCYSDHCNTGQATRLGPPLVSNIFAPHQLPPHKTNKLKQNLNIKPNFNNQQPGFSNLQSSFNNPQPSFNNLQSGFNNLQPGYSNLQPNLNNLQSFPGLEARPGNCEHNYDRNGADE